MEYILIFIAAVFVNNVVLAQFLGICPFLGVSKKVETAAGMGAAVTFVLTIATIVTFLVQKYILDAFGLGFMQTISFILIIAALVQMVEIILKKVSPALYQALGVFLSLIHIFYGGETNCSFGCLGYGDCVNACAFDAIHINPTTGIAEVDEEKCTSCGACVKACPKSIIELRKKGPKSRRIYVSCVNKDKGAAARKACANACIGCGKCAKECPFEAITVTNNVAYIDYKMCIRDSPHRISPSRRRQIAGYRPCYKLWEEV